LAVQRLAGIHAAVFFGPAVVRSMFRSGAGGVGAPAFFMISPFFSMQDMARTAIHAIRAVFPVLLINVAETANASLDMTAAVVEAAPIVSLISTT
jgi:hypothetical protein